MAHSRVAEALARGWTVTPVEARREPMIAAALTCSMRAKRCSRLKTGMRR
ncbi:MAG: hypothetical protein QP890_09510 [Corynebacterium amycolatum]|nr:hypothetical protein [Corynebacterium amycolatum]MDK8507658.1 hypothetical protein [Corynebacterium amycolatum]